MKKKILVTLVFATILTSLVGCGAQPQAEVKEEPAPIVEEVKEEAPAPVVEEVTEAETVEETVVTEEVAEEPAAPTYVEEKGFTVVDLDGEYQNDFTFISYNKDENEVVIPDWNDLFVCPTTITSEEVDNGDGTKTISYTCYFDIKNWSMEYYYYSSYSYLINTDTGRVFSKDFGANKVEVNGETQIADYKFEDEYDKGYTLHTKVFTLTCPADFDSYGLFLANTTSVNTKGNPEYLDDILTSEDAATGVVIK